MNLSGQGDQRLLRPPRTRALTRTRRGNRYALVIGINDYDVPAWKLANAVNDAEAIAGRLEEIFGYTVTRLLDKHASLDAIRRALSRRGAGAGPEDDLFVFFAGHGDNHPRLGSSPEGFLIPVDATSEPGTWLAEAEIVQWAKDMPCQRVFLVFDACYTGTAMRLSDAIQPGDREDQVLKILVAGTEDQPVLDGGARDHSVFTRALLDGLDGLADVGQQPDGVVSASELIVYVRSEVPWRSRMRNSEQTPVGGALQGTKGGYDFEFRPTEPRLSAAVLRNLYSQEPADRRAAAERLIDHRGRATATLAVGELNHLLWDDRPPYGRDVMSERGLLSVRKSAAEALGALGHPLGFSSLTTLLVPADPTDIPSELRATAAASLGVLVEKGLETDGYDLSSLRVEAIESLIESLQDLDRRVESAAMAGLGRLPESVPQLVEELELARSHPTDGQSQVGNQRWQPIVQALATVADRHPEDKLAWPMLSGLDAQLLRRIYLAHLRLQPHWQDIMRGVMVMGLLGALGLSMAYLVGVSAIFRDSIRVFGPATLAVAAPVGFLAGASYGFLPRLSCGAARYSTQTPPLLGALCAGLLLGLWMFIPNWFLGIGCAGSQCELYVWLLWLLPGLVVGPLLGLSLVWLRWRVDVLTAEPGVPATGPGMLCSNLLSFTVVTLIGGLGMFCVRWPRPLTFGILEPLWVEALLWGVGGALLGAMLAVGWYVTLPSSRQPTVNLHNLCQVLLRRSVE
jgi:hypothetical protein